MAAIANANDNSGSQVSERDMAILFGTATIHDTKEKSTKGKRASVKKELLGDFDAADEEAKQAGAKGPVASRMRTRNR